MRKVYVAYGSNINRTQMEKRCPDSRFLAVGHLCDYELAFRGSADSAYLTIVPKKGSSVPVVLWEIGDERELDRLEGYPWQYYKDTVTVEVADQSTVGMIYKINPNKIVGLPSRAYYAKVHQGYMDFAFDVKILDDALERAFREFYASALTNPQGTWTFFDGRAYEDCYGDE